MKRIFGGKKEPAPPPPSLTDATETVNKRASVLDEKIRALDKQLVDFKNQIKATRPGPAQERVKQRAMQVLKQKRMYEQQRDQV
jgi:charged multivesicular body protein 5